MSVCYESCEGVRVFPDEFGESCIVAVAGDARWHLNSSAACVFSLAVSGKNADEITAVLEELFEAEECDIAGDVAEVLEKMLDLKILKQTSRKDRSEGK